MHRLLTHNKRVSEISSVRCVVYKRGVLCYNLHFSTQRNHLLSVYFLQAPLVLPITTR